MPKCFCAFVVLKYECEFKVSELLNTACHGIFAKIQFDARSQQIAPEKKIFQLKLLRGQDQEPRLTEFCETEICIKQPKSNL